MVLLLLLFVVFILHWLISRTIGYQPYSLVAWFGYIYLLHQRMSKSVGLIPDDGSDKTMEEVQQATMALAPPLGVGRPLSAGNGLPGSVRDSDRPHLSMYQDNREFVQQINIMNNMVHYAEMRYAVTETRDEQFQKEYLSLMAYSDEMHASVRSGI